MLKFKMNIKINNIDIATSILIVLYNIKNV